MDVFGHFGCTHDAREKLEEEVVYGVERLGYTPLRAVSVRIGSWDRRVWSNSR